MSLFSGTAEAALYTLPSFPHDIFKGSLVDPRLRASNEHIPIVRVPRAGGRLDYPSHPSETARCTSTGGQQATHFILLLFPTSPSRGAARLSFTARIGRAPSERACSASMKDGLAAPLPFFL